MTTISGPMSLPAPVTHVARWLQDRGTTPWLVGGASRDLLLGLVVADFDFAIGGDGFTISRALADDVGGAWVPLDEARGVGRVVLHHQGEPLWIDLARFRAEGTAGGENDALRADLRLRDFSVNAIAVNPLSGEIVDPTDGEDDLRAHRLRATHAGAFLDDPLRILRGIRLQATRGFHLSPESLPLMRDAVPGLADVAGERVRDEWLKLLAPRGAAERVDTLHQLGVVAVLLPELAATEGVEQSAPHSHDVFGHSLLALAALEALWPWEGDPLWQAPYSPWRSRVADHLRHPLAHEVERWHFLKHVVLLHDIGKAVTRTVGKDQRIHFYGHEHAGAELMDAISERFKLSRVAGEYASGIVAAHLRPLHLSHRVPPRPKALYRFFRAVQSLAPDLLLHSLADQRGKAFATDRAEVVAVGRAILAAFFDQAERYVNVRPLLNGGEVIDAFGWQGPRIGQALEFLREQQAMGRISSKEEALVALRGWVPPSRR